MLSWLSDLTFFTGKFQELAQAWLMPGRSIYLPAWWGFWRPYPSSPKGAEDPPVQVQGGQEQLAEVAVCRWEGGGAALGMAGFAPHGRHPVSSPHLDELKVSPLAGIRGLTWLAHCVLGTSYGVPGLGSGQVVGTDEAQMCTRGGWRPPLPAQRDRRVLGVQPNGSEGGWPGGWQASEVGTTLAILTTASSAQQNCSRNQVRTGPDPCFLDSAAIKHPALSKKDLPFH